MSDAFPEDVGDARPAIHDPRQDEQEIAQPVQVGDDDARDILPRLSRERDGHSLGSPANGPGQVDLRGGRRATGQDELGQRLQLSLESVDRRFEFLDMPGRDRMMKWPVG